MAKTLGQLSIDYDRTTDVLYLSIGEPRPALTVEDRDGLLIRKDIKSGQPIGVTILNYESRFRRLTDVAWLRSLGLPADLASYLVDRPAL